MLQGNIFFPEVFPSPPPLGWSIGFIATPLTEGLIFNQRALPALPKVFKNVYSLETLPIVAKQWTGIDFNLPELRQISAFEKFFWINFAYAPADLIRTLLVL